MNTEIKKMTPNDIDELRKSLEALGMDKEEIDQYIEKAMKEDEEKEPEEGKEKEKEEEKEEGSEETIAEKAEGEEGKEKVEKSKRGKKIEKSAEEKDDEEYEKLKGEKEKIEKAMCDIEERTGKKPIQKSIGVDIEKAFGERFEDIEKSLTEKFEEMIDDQNEIIKSLKADIKKIGDSPIERKGVITNANFFEKGMEDGLNPEEKTLSITKDKDELLKSMQDEFEKEKDIDTRQMLQDGISDYTVNTVPTAHGIKALAHLSRRKNITLEQ